MIRAVVFDCFGVLTTDQWQLFCAHLPPDTDMQALHDLNHALDAGMVPWDAFSDQVEAICGRRPPELTALQTAALHKNTALLAYIQDLRPRLRIGLLSNISSDWITTTLLTTDEQALFDAMGFSYQLHMAKPEPGMFTYICDALHIQPHEAIMVDDIASNVAAAESVGMHGVHYTDFHACRQAIDSLIESE